MANMPVERSRASADTRRAAVVAYLIEGDAEKAGRRCGVPGRTIRQWTTKGWWAELVDECQAEVDERTRAGWQRIVDQAQAETLDRLQNGDERIVAGERVRVRMSGRDAAVTAGVAMDKLRIARGLPTRISRDVSGLSDLAAEFARIATEREKRIVSEQ